MKAKLVALATLAAAWPYFASAQSGGPFDLGWSSIDGGGGTSAGGGYSISGTIGQPDAGVPLAGGNFSLIGGFWSVVQTPGAPLLSIVFTGNGAKVSWPSPSTGFILQQKASVNAANWTAAPESIADNGTNRFIVVQPSSGSRFYRLFKP